MSAKLLPYNYYFAIINPNDYLLYETHFFNVQQTAEEDPIFQKQFVIHAALDLVDRLQWRTQNMFLKSVDKYDQWYVSAFVAPSVVRFMVVHDVINEVGIRSFFYEVLDVFIKFCLNPFYEDSTKIRSEDFHKKVQICGKRYLCLWNDYVSWTHLCIFIATKDRMKYRFTEERFIWLVPSSLK